MANRATVNLSTFPGYRYSFERLRNTLQQYDTATHLFWNNYRDIGSPEHHMNPYAFKIYAIDAARARGYNHILWLDSSMFAIKDTSPIWDVIAENGFMMVVNGCLIGNWTNDKTLNHFGLSRDEAMNMPMFYAGFFGFNFEEEVVREFYARWRNAMLQGWFKGKWDNNTRTESQDERCRGHRHDMSVASIILYQMGLNTKFQHGMDYLQIGAAEAPVNNDTVCFKAQGIG